VVRAETYRFTYCGILGYPLSTQCNVRWRSAWASLGSGGKGARKILFFFSFFQAISSIDENPSPFFIPRYFVGAMNIREVHSLIRYRTHLDCPSDRDPINNRADPRYGSGWSFERTRRYTITFN